jgi:hypothetical protein
MAYRDFKMETLNTKFSIVQASGRLFGELPHVAPSVWLTATLERNSHFPKTTEKAVSEYLINPILSEIVVLNSGKITLLSGEQLNADKLQNLNGEVDFMFLHIPYTVEVQSPVICITEAKLNQATEKSIPQAAAQMFGAQVFNKNHDKPTETMYGAVTDGEKWIFLKLQNLVLTIDTERYVTKKLDELLGVLHFIVQEQMKTV